MTKEDGSLAVVVSEGQFWKQISHYTTVYSRLRAALLLSILLV
jgi:hypothetical protein